LSTEEDSKGKRISAELISDGNYYRYHLISNEDNCNVYAVSIKHRIPTYGFIIIENNLPGKFDIDKLRQKGIKPGAFCSKLVAGEQVILENGQILKPEEFVGPSRNGRKVVILGDCSNASNVTQIGMYCDVIVHEATHDDSLREKAIEFGHSTPSMAAHVAEKCQAKCLLLNHFSQRYRPIKQQQQQEEEAAETTKKKVKTNEKEDNTEDDNLLTVELLLTQAKQCFLSRPVFIAEDFFSYIVPLPK